MELTDKKELGVYLSKQGNEKPVQVMKYVNKKYDIGQLVYITPLSMYGVIQKYITKTVPKDEADEESKETVEEVVAYELKLKLTEKLVEHGADDLTTEVEVTFKVRDMKNHFLISDKLKVSSRF